MSKSGYLVYKYDPFSRTPLRGAYEANMAYDQGLAERVREILGASYHVEEKKMFGGLAFLFNGHMFIGIIGDVLMARVGLPAYEAALGCLHVREMDFTGKPLRGYVFVDPLGFENDADLEKWVTQCHKFVQSLPAKPAKVRAAKKR